MRLVLDVQVDCYFLITCGVNATDQRHLPTAQARSGRSHASVSCFYQAINYPNVEEHQAFFRPLPESSRRASIAHELAGLNAIQALVHQCPRLPFQNNSIKWTTNGDRHSLCGTLRHPQTDREASLGGSLWHSRIPASLVNRALDDSFCPRTWRRGYDTASGRRCKPRVTLLMLINPADKAASIDRKRGGEGGGTS